MPEFTDITIPTLFHYLLVHALFFITIVYFFYADYGTLYEELLVCAKNTSRVAY